MKTKLLLLIFAINVAASTRAQTTYTLGLWGQYDVSNSAVSGTSNVLMDSLVVNVGDVIIFYNTTGSVQSFNVNSFHSSSIAYASSFNYTVTSSDMPDIIVTNNGSVTFVDNVHVKIKVNSQSAGIANNEPKIEFKSFPNPVTNELNINSYKVLGEVSVVNLNGQTIFAEVINSNTTKINLQDYDAGIYIISVGNSKQKFIKQ